MNFMNNKNMNNLIVDIDISNDKSWNLNNDLSVVSLISWDGAYSSDIELYDFGLTQFDYGRTDKMWSGVSLNSQDTKLRLDRIGYNEVINPNDIETTGVTVITNYLPITPIIDNINGNYYDLNGGYLQGFFKLYGYDYQILPTRYKNGITIETVLNIYDNSNGIFLMLGARAEDKYNPYYIGEFESGATEINGVVTSDNNYLDALMAKQVLKNSFPEPEFKTTTIHTCVDPIDNLKNNIIAFEITNDKKIGVKYINSEGLVISNISKNSLTITGFTYISIVYLPYSKLNCNFDAQRNGDLIFYINGRKFWKLTNFPEFYFKEFSNDKEKQIGVPFSISWGGGSFGLKHSWHYGKKTYLLYNNNDIDYVNSNFNIIKNPLLNDNIQIDNFSLNVNNSKFYTINNLNNIQPVSVLEVKRINNNDISDIFIRYNKLVSILSNRNYIIEALIYVDNYFTGGTINKISLLPYSNDVDINILSEIIYTYPYNIENSYNQSVYGEKSWKLIKTVFNIDNNIGQKFINIGILIETNGGVNMNGSLFIKEIKYIVNDILVKDERKNNLLIEKNFDKSFIGGIQKLKIYDIALNSSEILNNVIVDSKKYSNIKTNKGGRLIYW